MMHKTIKKKNGGMKNGDMKRAKKASIKKARTKRKNAPFTGKTRTT